MAVRRGSAWFVVMHYCVLAIATCHAQPPDADDVERVADQEFEIHFKVDEGSHPLESASIWCTDDAGRKWWKLLEAEKPCSPAVVPIPGEGLFGLYIVLKSAAGVSTELPIAGTDPHRWVYIDRTPPLVQLHAPAVVDGRRGGRAVQIRWSVIEDDLGERPIRLAYRHGPDGEWTPLGEPLANSGAWDWNPPEDLFDDVVIRLSVADRAGNHSEATSEVPALKRRPAPDDRPNRPEVPIQEAAHPAKAPRVSNWATLSEPAVSRAVAKYRQGMMHSLRGEYRLAASRLGEALTADPEMTEALVALGRALYASGEAVKAIEAYQLALQQEPDRREALDGLARVYLGERQYAEAVESLSRIVRMRPHDVEAWLLLGDVAIYQGNERMAEEYYTRAATLDPGAGATIAKANKRLKALQAVLIQPSESVPTPSSR